MARARVGEFSPPEAETLFAFEHSIEAANSPIFSEICWKTAKNAPFHMKSPVKNFHGRAKGGHRTVAPPKYATADIPPPRSSSST